MLIEPSNAIILFLSITILVFIFFIIKLNILFYNKKKGFKKKIRVLGEIIIQISKNKSRQHEKIKLSEDLKNKIKTINTSLNSEIFELNRDLFEIVSKNNLA